MDKPARGASERDVKRKLGGLFLMGFEGTAVTPSIRSLIEEYGVGAIIMKATNFVSAEQAITLIRDLQIIAHNAGHEHPLLIAADQENGTVQSIADPRWITQLPSSLGVAATHSTSYAYEVALATGREMSCLGINWVIGPAVDVILDRSVAGFGSRSFGDDPAQVAKLGAAYIRGLRDAGVASTAKHFPLGGSLKLDESSTTVPVVFETLDQLRQKVIIPFQEAIREGVDSIMAAGCAISSIGPKLMHACFSKKVVTDLLRQQLGYDGVAVSECLAMESIATHIGVGQATVMGIHAGCDILNLCHSFPLQLEALTALSLALETGALSWSLVQKSANRVLRLRAKHTSWSRALNPPGLTHLATLRPNHRILAEKIYEESITLVRDEYGYVPLSRVLSETSKLVVFSPLLYHRAMMNYVKNAGGQLRTGNSPKDAATPKGENNGSAHVSQRRRYSSSPNTTRQASGSSRQTENLQYGEDYFQDFGRALASYNLGEILHTSYTSHGVRSGHEQLIDVADAILILVADANHNQYQLSFAKHVCALSQLRRQQNRQRGPAVILVSLGTAYDVPPEPFFPAHVCTYDSSAIALQCLARVLGGEITPNKRIPGLQLGKESTNHSQNSSNNKHSAHQQAWLVERFVHSRDSVALRQFLASLYETEGDYYTVMPGDGGDDGDGNTDGSTRSSNRSESVESNDATAYAASYADAILLSGDRFAPDHAEAQHFVTRNTSTGAIYGFSSTIVFPQVRRACLSAIFVDPGKRNLSMGRDLHTSVVRYLAQHRPDVNRIQLGAPVLAGFPGLPMSKTGVPSPSSTFFEKLGWDLQPSDPPRKVTCLLYKQVANISPSRPPPQGDLQFAAGHISSTGWDEVVHFADAVQNDPGNSGSDVSDLKFSSLIYQEAAAQSERPVVVTARSKSTGDLQGILLLLDGRDSFGKNFPLVHCQIQPTVAYLCPMVAQSGRSNDQKATLQGLHAEALVDTRKQLHTPNALAYNVPPSMTRALEEMGFSVHRTFAVVERPIGDFS